MALFYLLLGLGLTAAGSWAAGQGAQLSDSCPGCGIPPCFRPWSCSCPGWRSSPPGMPRSQRRWWTGLPPRWSAPCPGCSRGFPAGAASLTARWLSRLPALLLGSVFTVILSFCVAADYPRLCALLRDKVPPG